MIRIRVYHNLSNDGAPYPTDYDHGHKAQKVFEFTVPQTVRSDVNLVVDLLGREVTEFEGIIGYLYSRENLRPFRRGDIVHVVMGKYVNIWYDYTGTGWNISTWVPQATVDEIDEINQNTEDLLDGIDRTDQTKRD